MGKHNKESRKIFKLKCKLCNKEFEARISNGMYCSKLCRGRARNQIPKIIKICPICNKEFKTSHESAITCSIECQGKRYSLIHAKRRLDEFQDYKYRGSARRKKRLKEQWVENVDLQVLIYKYNGICQLCNEPVDLTVSGNHNLYPSRDHIVPLNKGGLHSYENCQLAHRVCNSRKGDSIDADRNGEAICQ